MMLKTLLISLSILLLSSSRMPIPPGVLKKDVKKICSCYKEFISLESKDFPKTSPIYQEAKLSANTALLQVENHISEKRYTMDEFNKMMKKRCPDIVKKLQTIAVRTANN